MPPIETTAPPTLCAQRVAAYLDTLATQRRMAALTLRHYRHDLQHLVELCAERPPEALTAYDIRRLVARLHGGGLAAPSLARALSAWRGFFRWLMRQHGAPANPAEGVRPPRGVRRLPRVLSPEQASVVLEAGGDEEIEVRDRAIFELCYSSGLRVAELASLDVSGSVDVAQRLVTVTGKRGKTRIVPVGEPALRALADWLAVRPGWLRDVAEPALFLTRSGGRLSSEAMRGRLARLAQVSGLGVHVHPHMLRHSFASHVLQSSGDLRAVQELLGHASIRSTQVYTHLDFQHLAKVYDTAHPRARRKPKDD